MVGSVKATQSSGAKCKDNTEQLETGVLYAAAHSATAMLGVHRKSF